MFRRVVNRQPVPKLSAFVFTKGVDYGFPAMDIEVVHDEMDGLCIGILIHDGFYYMSESRGCPVRSRRGEVPSSLWFYDPKHIGRATAFVFVIRS